jgi:hypothetical protein
LPRHRCDHRIAMPDLNRSLTDEILTGHGLTA